MDLTEQWYKDIELTCDDFDKVFITKHEFESVLQRLIAHPNSPLMAVEYQLNFKSPFESIILGKSSSDESTDVKTLSNFDEKYGTSCRITTWQKRDQAHDTARITELLSQLINSYWKPDLRDKSRLISLDSPEHKKIADNSIVRFVQGTGALFILFCDLDEFKRINGKYGHDVGDRVILELSSVIHKTITDHAIPIHRSGDEFTILYPAQNPDEALFLARELMQSMTEHDYQLEEEIRISAGITVINRDQEFVSYEDLELRAERALQPTENIKYRGMARFESKDAINLPVKSEFSLHGAFCLIKSCLNTSRPFESPWLNIISRNTYELLQSGEWEVADVPTSIEALINWIQPELNEGIMRSAVPVSQSSDFSPVLSTFDLALAVAHGVLRSGLINKDFDTSKRTLEIKYDRAAPGNCHLRLMPDDLPLARFGNTEIAAEIWDLGGFVYVSSDKDTDAVDTRRALLVKIGHSDLQIPTLIFAEEIIVDDRPTRGGGLPDFWEATVAKVIAEMNVNDNIAVIYITGKHEHGAQTIDKLTNLNAWRTNTEQLSYKTGMSFQSILTAAERLNGKVILPSSEEELIANLAGVLLNSYELRPKSQVTNLQSSRRFFRRDPSIGEMALGMNDGCRIDTIAKAFPVVLEIARKFSGEEVIIDQAGRGLKELVDFKVHLTNPTQDVVPAFYEADEESLEKYFNDQFKSDSGLFGSVFNGLQLDTVMNHLVQAITNSKHQHSTRRAVLIVPSHIKDDKDFTPLGLISVRIIPRFPQNRILLHFSYTWRTVEALVGFPYSLYGSVRYSQYLTDELGKLLRREYAMQLGTGYVSYIAHSLHIFTDEHGQNIARKIVEDVTT